MLSARNWLLKKAVKAIILISSFIRLIEEKKKPNSCQIAKEKKQLGSESHIIQLPRKNDNGHKNIIKIYKACS